MTEALYHAYITPQGRGVLTLPADLRRRMGLEQEGAQIEVTERADGVVELRAAVPVPASERWFWSARWQEGERAVDDHVAAGRVATFDSEEDFLASLGQT